MKRRVKEEYMREIHRCSEGLRHNGAADAASRARSLNGGEAPRRPGGHILAGPEQSLGKQIVVGALGRLPPRWKSGLPPEAALSMKIDIGVARLKSSVFVYSVPSGWKPIIRNLRKSLIYIESRHGLDGLKIDLISKDREMTIKFDGGSAKTTKAIIRAIGKSRKTCQICGIMFQTEVNLRFYELFGKKTFRVCDDCLKVKLDPYPSIILFMEDNVATIQRKIAQACDALDLYYTYIRTSREGCIYIGISRIDFWKKITHQTYHCPIKCPGDSNWSKFPLGSCGVIAYGLTRNEAGQQERDAIALVDPDWLINRNGGGSTGPNMYAHVGRIFARIFDFRKDQNIHIMLGSLDSQLDGPSGEFVDKIILEAVNEYYEREMQNRRMNSLSTCFNFAEKRGYQRREELKKSMAKFLEKEALEWISDKFLI